MTYEQMIESKNSISTNILGDIDIDNLSGQNVQEIIGEQLETLGCIKGRLLVGE